MVVCVIGVLFIIVGVYGGLMMDWCVDGEVYVLCGESGVDLFESLYFELFVVEFCMVEVNIVVCGIYCVLEEFDVGFVVVGLIICGVIGWFMLGSIVECVIYGVLCLVVVVLCDYEVIEFNMIGVVFVCFGEGCEVLCVVVGLVCVVGVWLCVLTVFKDEFGDVAGVYVLMIGMCFN